MFDRVPEPVFTIAVIAVTCLVSIHGFRDPSFVQRFIFWPEAILRDKQGYRLITAGFLHLNWFHLLGNMYSLYAFGKYMEMYLGALPLLTIYFSSIVGGDLLSLFLHRHHDYRALGASGGVCGVIFASIFLLGSDIRFLFLPLPIPAWLYAIAYLLFFFYGIKAGKDNVGHDAHLGGAIIGLVVATGFYPEIVTRHPVLYSVVMGLSIAMLLYILKNPLFLPWQVFVRSSPRRRPVKPPKPALTQEEQAEQVDAILDKLSRSGMGSLTRAEQEILREAARRGRGGRKPDL
ncbi:MAG TPA: rhomboid family intramembrane serine protease [Verrucomicrobiae bacterium]|nr:rhomboid family intramembrane serine protease [Verrucomicrobiae bacterium]